MTLEQLRTELIKRRKETGLNQTDMVKKSELPQCTISAIETGRITPTYGNLTKYAKAFGLEISIKLTDPKTGEVIE